MAKVIIGCRLPNGLTLTHPVTRERVTLAGLHSAKIIGAKHVTTEVDADFWDTWKAAYPEYAPLKTGAIFEAKNETDAKAKAIELRDEKTGFEELKPDAMGVKPAEK